MFKVVKEEENLMEMETDSITVASLLVKYLNLDERVEVAAFRQEHPLEDKVSIYFRVKEGSPRAVLKEVLSKIKSDIKELREAMLSLL